MNSKQKIKDIKKDINILEEKIKNLEEKNKQNNDLQQKNIKNNNGSQNINIKENINKDSNNIKHKERKKYNKRDKPIIFKEIQYYEDYKEDKIWKYYIHSFNKNFIIIYYNCLVSK